jgi:hypothetical protein
MMFDPLTTHHYEASSVMERFVRAKQMRESWESLWQDCYDYALPTRIVGANTRDWKQAYQSLFDGTAADAVDQLASALLANLVPPWSSFAVISAGPKFNDAQRAAMAPMLDQVNQLLHDHFRRSNFTVELHQALLDMVTVGTCCMRFDETDPGSLSAFSFRTIPLTHLYLQDEDARGLFMRMDVTLTHLMQQCPGLNMDVAQKSMTDKGTIPIIYTVMPRDMAIDHLVITDPVTGGTDILWQDVQSYSPFIVARWQKTGGEYYGRSPVMKALPDIKTANKVVELILKNASIAVTGIWQADDDGVLNPANIKLTPGTIIPKAVGSSGLTPLQMPGNFDMSQLVLDDLRRRIKQALLADRLSSADDKRMTATEILERSADAARLLSAVYSRLQSELLIPLVERALSILQRRGLIPAFLLDGHEFTVDFVSPLARAQNQADIQATLAWLNSVQQFGESATQTLNVPKMLHWLGQQLGVPAHLMTPIQPLSPPTPDITELQS